MTEIQAEPGSLSTPAFSGGRWGAVRGLVLQLASLLTTAILARLLTQEEFGLVAITVIVVMMFDLITRVGFGAAVIRRAELSPAITSTLFWASSAVGAAAAVLAIAVSEPAAVLAGSHDAAPLVAVAALTLPLNLAARVPLSLLSRALRFRAVALIDVAGSVIHAVVAVSLAFLGLGAGAVVIGQVCRSSSILIGSMAAARFLPGLAFQPRIIKEDLRYGTGLLGSEIVGYANKNADYWFVGNRLGTEPLGVYYLAYVLPTLLRRRITAIGQEVLFPIVARFQQDAERTRLALLRVTRLIAFLVIPAMIGLAALADLVVSLAFGSGWGEAVPPLRVVALAAAVTSLTASAHAVFPAMGKPGVLVISGLLSLAALLAGLAFSLRGGTLTRVAIAVLAAAMVESAVMQSRVKATLGLPHRHFAAAVAPFITASSLMGAVIWGLRLAIDGRVGEVAALLTLGAAGIAAYLLVGLTLFRAQFLQQLGAVRRLVWR